ncbi:LPXTG cell wall anchor domain-containing protein [Nesterenkonia flava]|uniref:LPXTG cell wall anchor domain-containing protein n=1 Tax=Nesterenkonia flava TaxID=469799 RepID=A0ABU1FUE7_9MICC|nr:LPXTG cell wall anchor domain-containing protein [Nesterenkonia flava]MDR5711877.1 LPXTG cell wall anchor domain-containing protein [Nesterenkonia flava]
MRSITDHRTPVPRTLTAAIMAAALGMTAATSAHATAGTGASPDYAPPTADNLSEDTYSNVLPFGGDFGDQLPIGTHDYSVFFDSSLAGPDDYDVWVLQPEGDDSILIGEFSFAPSDGGEGEANAIAAEDFTLGTLAEEVDQPGDYAIAITDDAGEVIAWSQATTPPHIAGDYREASWPIPADAAQQQPDVGTVDRDTPVTVSDLTEDGYGVVSRTDSDDLTLVPGELFTLQAEHEQLASVANAAFWLVYPEPAEVEIEGTTQRVEALHLGSTPTFYEPSVTLDEPELDPDYITYSGIYAVAVLDEETGEIIGWSPFGVDADGQGIQPGQPGVNENDTNTDRSIYPIPDSVPVPGEEDQEEGGADPQPEDDAQEGSEEETPAPGDNSPSPAGEEPADETAAPDAENSEAASDTGPLALTGPAGIIGLSAAGLLLLGAGSYLIYRSRNKTDDAGQQL